MRTRTIVTTGLLTLMLCAGLLLRPSLAQTAATGPSCITTIAGNTCLAQCIGSLQQSCGADAGCHQTVAAAVSMLAETPAGTAMCAAEVANAKAVCGCS
jgi:hypothetical protein